MIVNSTTQDPHEVLNIKLNNMKNRNNYDLVSMNDEEMDAFILSNQITSLIAESRTDNF